MIHLKAVRLDRSARSLPDAFPFNITALASFERLEFTAPLTFFVGENGSGKSTLLEAIALAAGAIAAGSDNVERDQSLNPVRQLAKRLRLAWTKRTHKGFFLRAEDFFGYARRLAQMRESLEADLRAVDEEYIGRSEKARGLAKLASARELHALRERYGKDLDNYSHGESFLKFFQARFIPNGLYLLDEPEAPLSPLRQLAFISMLKQMLEQDAQFIIATHSPLIMALPGAVILSFDQQPIQPIGYAQTEHYTLTRAFLNNPDSFLQKL